MDASDRWIVVGFDGSEGADRALDWALAEANLRGARVLVVHAYEKCLGGVDPIVAELVARDAQAVLDRALSRAREEEVDAEGILMDESPTKALTEASEGAELLVVGSRGLGGLTGALLGSVSTACVRHATCPILVVPSPARAERARTGEAAGNADQLDGSSIRDGHPANVALPRAKRCQPSHAHPSRNSTLRARPQISHRTNRPSVSE